MALGLGELLASNLLCLCLASEHMIFPFCEAQSARHNLVVFPDCIQQDRPDRDDVQTLVEPLDMAKKIGSL